MQLIAKQTVGSGGAASVSFSNIPQTYTDLKVVYSARTTRSSVGSYCYISFNGSASNFSGILLGGYGTGVTSASQAQGAGVNTDANATANNYNNTDIYIPNYTSTTIAKSFSTDSVSEDNSSTGFDYLFAGLWNPGTQAAITSLTLTPESGGALVQYSTFYLYGISSSSTQNTSVPLASGGDVITTDGTYWYHTFLYSGTFTPLKNLTCDYLVVAGGGGGGVYYGGGGGAGGYKTSIGGTALSLIANTAYTSTVGAGGAGATSTSNKGVNGTDSIFSSITSTAGGGGASRFNIAGSNGGSGGGGSRDDTTGTSGAGGSASPSGQGNAGATAGVTNGGGGGGASAAGSSENGGNGLANSISGTSVTYAGGGGGGRGASAGGTGGTGGGGAGGNDSTVAIAGTPNTGGGGGGGASSQGGGKQGGSGIIIVRYAV
jgi:hypothetical protein